MTAPYKRSDTDDLLGVNRHRLKLLEATRSQPDATRFGWAEAIFPPYDDPGAAYDPNRIIGYGGADPTGYNLANSGLITDNLLAHCNVIVSRIGGFNAGSGSQYLIPLAQYPPYNYGVPSFPSYGPLFLPDSSYWSMAAGAKNPPMGVATAYDSGTGLYQELHLRVSEIDYMNLTYGSTVGVWPFLEAYNPVDGNLWGPTYPYTWAAGDVLLMGSFSFHLATSLIDTMGT